MWAFFAQSIVRGVGSPLAAPPAPSQGCTAQTAVTRAESVSQSGTNSDVARFGFAPAASPTPPMRKPF
jgi:hypothetical protein